MSWKTPLMVDSPVTFLQGKSCKRFVAVSTQVGIYTLLTGRGSMKSVC